MSITGIRLIDLGPAPFWQTQAVYHAVAGLMNESAPDTIILTSPRTPYLCLGYHDVYDAVLDRAAVARRLLLHRPLLLISGRVRTRTAR